MRTESLSLRSSHFLRRHSLGSRIHLIPFEKSPKHAIKRVFVSRIHTIQIQIERCLRRRAFRRIQFVEWLLRLESNIWSQVRRISEDLAQWTSIMVKLRELAETEHLFNSREHVGSVHKTTNHTTAIVSRYHQQH